LKFLLIIDRFDNPVSDLKKLIKKEEKKRRERKRKELEGHPLEAATLPGTSASASLYSTTDTERASSASITNSTPPGRPAGTRIGTGTDEVDVITLTPPNRHPPQPVPEPRRKLIKLIKIPKFQRISGQNPKL